MDAPFLTLDEAAELLRVTARWLQRSDCPRIRIGGKVRYDRASAVEWFRAGLDRVA
jgi:hypothetical protein